MSKYVRLNEAKTEWASALYSQKPLKINRLPDDQIQQYGWYPVKEHIPGRPDPVIYTTEIGSWDVDEENGIVNIHYVPVLLPTETIKDRMIEYINAKRDSMLGKGITFDGNRFDTERDTISRIIAVVVKASMDANFTTQWVTDDNQTITLTAPEIIALGNAYATYESSVIFFARQLKDQIIASDNPETIEYKNVEWPTDTFNY